MDATSEPHLTASAAHGYQLLRESCGSIPSEDLAFVELRGEDRKGWLQGQATNDLRELSLGGSAQFCLCSPTGQLLAMCTVWSLTDRLLISTSTAEMPAFLERCEAMIILEDVQVRDLRQDFHVVSIQGPTASSEVGKLMHLPTLDGGDSRLGDTELVCLRSNRTGYGGWDLLLPRGSTSADLEGAFDPVDPAAVEVTRLEAGIPKFGQDADGKTLPPELGPAFESRNISYTKGCYTGQEVLMRIHSRGHTNRTWMALVAESPIQAGAKLRHRLREDAGVVTSAAHSPDFGFIGAGFVRNEVAEQNEQVEVISEGASHPAHLRHMPLLRF